MFHNAVAESLAAAGDKRAFSVEVSHIIY